MRVIAGSAGGIRLVTPRGRETRPTADRVKEALFSILENQISFSGLNILDLCAGTGSLGIEALSRGAEKCYFVEKNRAAITLIEKNLLSAHFSARAEIIREDARQAIAMLAKREIRVDLVFLDPPYTAGLYSGILSALGDGVLLADGGHLIVEHSPKEALQPIYGRLQQSDSRKYGDSSLTFFSIPSE